MIHAMIHKVTGYMYIAHGGSVRARMTIEYFYNGRVPFGWEG